MTQLIDIGANLTHDAFDKDLESVLELARNHDIAQMIVTGASLNGSRQAVALAARHPGFLYATAGIHPHEAEEATDAVLEQVRQLARQPEVCAIGETGLDFFRDLSPRDQQIASFEAHLDIACASGLPLFLHERDAAPTFAEVLAAWRPRLDKVVVHCFTGDRQALHAYLDLDCYIGLTGWVCDERRGSHLPPLLRDIPADRLMIETDSPYLIPRNILPRPRTRRNEPQFLSWVCRFIAAALNEPYEEIARRTTENARRFFDLSEACGR